MHKVIVKLGNVFVNKFLLANAKQVFLKLFFLIRIFKNSLDSYNKFYNNAKDDATLLDYNGEVSFNHMSIKKVITKG